MPAGRARYVGAIRPCRILRAPSHGQNVIEQPARHGSSVLRRRLTSVLGRLDPPACPLRWTWTVRGRSVMLLPAGALQALAR